MGHPKKLAGFERGAVIGGRHSSNKSFHTRSSLVDVPQAAVSGIIAKWQTV